MILLLGFLLKIRMTLHQSELTSDSAEVDTIEKWSQAKKMTVNLSRTSTENLNLN